MIAHLIAWSWHLFFLLQMTEKRQVRMKVIAQLVYHPLISAGLMNQLKFLLQEYFSLPNCPGLQDEENLPCSQRNKQTKRQAQLKLVPYQHKRCKQTPTCIPQYNYERQIKVSISERHAAYTT